MARLGIDFGTTNTVATLYDRGVFTAVLHGAATGAGTVVQEVFPSAILVDRRTGQCWYGLEADRRYHAAAGDPHFALITSLKRRLRDYTQGAVITLPADPSRGLERMQLGVADLLTGFLRALADSIRQSQSIPADEPLEAAITWPANANGAQRHITRQCFREAGFTVLATLNEPTASAIELADWLRAGRKRGDGQAALPAGTQRQAVAVFDLGGGTFDVSVVWVEDQDFEVLASSGIEQLGGDDFDQILLDLLLKKINVSAGTLSPVARHALLRHARAQKESIANGAVRSLMLNPMDFGLKFRPVSLRVETLLKRLRPLLEPAIRLLGEVIAAAGQRRPGIEDGPNLTLYLVGGSSRLPLVAEMIAAAYPGSRVVLTDKPFRSVSMGASICAMDRVTYREVFARHFGLIRLRDHGQAETFDTIFPAGTPIPRRQEPPLERVSWYHPAHNIGHLRYLECTALGRDGMPADGVRLWSDILFPYDPQVPLSAEVDGAEIIGTDAFAGCPVSEVYRCDADGVITVEVQRPATRESRCYEIYRD